MSYHHSVLFSLILKKGNGALQDNLLYASTKGCSNVEAFCLHPTQIPDELLRGLLMIIFTLLTGCKPNQFPGASSIVAFNLCATFVEILA